MNMVNQEARQEKYKILFVAILVAVSCFSIYYFHIILHIGTVFTHFFYIPIILAAIWWKKRGVWVAAFLALLLIISHLYFRTDSITANDYLRAFMFVVIASVVAVLSEKIEKSHRERKRILNELTERVKELNCLYQITAIVEDPKNSIFDVLSKIVGIIPDAMQYPDIASTEIEYKGETFKTDNFKETKWNFKTRLYANNVVVGNFTVCYIEKPANAPVFLKEAYRLIDAISERIEKIIEKFDAKTELKTLQKKVISISEQERLRIGHDLHDGMGQLLTGISFLLRTATKKVNETVEEKITEMDELSKLVKTAAVLCRQMSKGLPVLDIKHDGLLLAIDQLSNEIREVYNVNCELSINEGFGIYDNFLASQIYRIIQESVNNAVKHGEADNIVISLSNDQSNMYLTISDDGKGIIDSKKRAGMGIDIMKYRADLMGAVFSAGNLDNCGFEVSLAIPNKI